MNESSKNISQLFNRPLVFVDIETTGMGARTHEVIEVAAIRVENGEVVSEVNELIQPRHNVVSPFITDITGISQNDVADAPFFEDIAAPLIEQFKGNALFVAHNVHFDFKFLNTAYYKLGVTFTPALFCTVKMSRALYGKERRHSLEAIIQHHDISVDNRHRAYDDAAVMWEFMQIAYREKGELLFAEVVDKQKARILPDNGQTTLSV